MEDQLMCSIDLVGSLTDEIFQVCFVGGGVPRGVNIFFLSIYLLALLGLRCCVRAFSSAESRGYSLIVVCRPLIVEAHCRTQV